MKLSNVAPVIKKRFMNCNHSENRESNIASLSLNSMQCDLQFMEFELCMCALTTCRQTDILLCT